MYINKGDIYMKKVMILCFALMFASGVSFAHCGKCDKGGDHKAKCEKCEKDKKCEKCAEKCEKKCSKKKKCDKKGD